MKLVEPLATVMALGGAFDAPIAALRPVVTPLVDAFLTDPGPNWAVELGRLRPLTCTP